MDKQLEIREEAQALPAGYEAPRVETALTAEDLEREVFFAGFASSAIKFGPSKP